MRQIGHLRLDAVVQRQNRTPCKTQMLLEKALPFEMRVPNALTAATLVKSERGEDVHHAKDANALFGQLGI
jgi:antitoxin component of RelBE/YafQ-DinJ toxin-antitoxin module